MSICFSFSVLFQIKYSAYSYIMKMNIMRLKLYAPLFYQSDESLAPFDYSTLTSESLFCFELSASQCNTIEPDASCFIQRLLFKGKAIPSPSSQVDTELPAGKYVFAQEWGEISKEDTLFMALEVQKEGLWERLDLDNRLYVRYLVEDGKQVTQIFRPYVCELEDEEE